MATFALKKQYKEMRTDCLKGINTLRYSDIFLAMYSDNGSSCLHRNHSHVLVYMYSGELKIRNAERSPGCTKGIVPLSARISACISPSRHAMESSSKPYS